MDLRGFPRRRLRATDGLFRVHPAELGPWWFSSDGLGRFDLPAPDGTCYLALSPVGAFIEVLCDFTYVTADDVSARSMSRLPLPADMVLADCTSSRALSFGATAELHSTRDYATTQAWAGAFRAGGFDGVRYFCRHDPSQREVAVAIFGETGGPDWPVEASAPIGDDVALAVEQQFGIHVLPTP